MTANPPLPDRIKKTIGPNMLLGLQDAELHDEPGAERIHEWVDWIANAVAPLVADEVRAEVDRIRAAVTEGKSIGRPLTASDVQVAHEVTRKALANALGAGLHLNWPQLVDEAQRSHTANAAWKADLEKAQRRGDSWKRMEETVRADRDRADKALKQAEQRARALEAVLARVGQMADAWEQRLPATIVTATAVDAIRGALERVDSAPPLDHRQILDRAIARLKSVPIQCTALTGPAWYGSGWKDAIGEFEEYAWRLDPLPEPATATDPQTKEG